MRIAIIDGVNQDIGLKILFPEADYYINNIELDKSNSHRKYGIIPNTDWSNIKDENYDYLFIIIALYDTNPGTEFYKQNIYDILQKELKIINENNFKQVYVFDNYDYDYDPNDFLQNEKITKFFKRNYNKTKNYKENVLPFPFIMFGQISLIEKMENIINKPTQKHNRVFFTGTLFEHMNDSLKYYRNRIMIYNQIRDFIYNPGELSYDVFMTQLAESKFALDLNGVGDPNKRTFEILSQGSLRIGEYNELNWPFIEEFSEETIFKTADEFKDKIIRLSMDSHLYDKCLEQQNQIFSKYFNKKWIKEYILYQLL